MTITNRTTDLVKAPDTTSRIATARDQLTAKLTELRRRETRVRAVVAPLRHLASPWVGISLAVIVGYRVGRPGASSAVTPVARPETLVGAIVRAGIIVIAQSLARRAVTALVEERGAVDTST